MDYLALLGVISLSLPAIVVILLLRYFRLRGKQRAKIAAQFGEVPEPVKLVLPQDYWAAYHEVNGADGAVDDHTWQNLDMDAVYQRVNACQCEAGDILLYRRLRQHPAAQDIQRQEDLGRYFSANKTVMLDIMRLLKRMGRSDCHSMKALTLTPELLQNQWKTLVTVLSFLPFAALPAFFVSPFAGIWAVLGSLLCNFVATILLKSRIYAYRVVYPLAGLVYVSQKLLPFVAECEPALAAEMRQCLGACKKADTAFFFMRFSDICAEIGFPDILSLFLAPLWGYYSVINFVKQERATVARLYNLAGEIDLACGLCSFRASLPFWAAPQFVEDRRFSGNNLYHPLPEKAVANNINLAQNMLLTGSNASGKSTFIKTVALNMILAQSLNTTCARQLCMHRAEVVTAMAVTDSIFEGDSYFMAEIKAMKRLVRAADGPGFCYLFIDEILRGTNTVERIAAAAAFLAYFCKNNVVCLAASHDIELVAITSPQYAQYHFSEDVKDGEVQFNYKIREGSSQTRNALKLLALQRFPSVIVESAYRAVERFEDEGIWV